MASQDSAGAPSANVVLTVDPKFTGADHGSIVLALSRDGNRYNRKGTSRWGHRQNTMGERDSLPGSSGCQAKRFFGQRYRTPRRGFRRGSRHAVIRTRDDHCDRIRSLGQTIRRVVLVDDRAVLDWTRQQFGDIPFRAVAE